MMRAHKTAQQRPIEARWQRPLHRRTRLVRFLFLKGTDRSLILKNRSCTETEEPNRSIRVEPNAQAEGRASAGNGLRRGGAVVGWWAEVCK